MDDSLVYRKTRRGATELATHGALSGHARAVLILLDGERSVADLAELFGAEQVERIIADLEARGYARQADPDDLGLTTLIVPSTGAPAAGESAVLTAAENADEAAAPAGHARRTPAWIAAGVASAALAGAAGYWFVWRPSHVLEPAVAAARPNDANEATPLRVNDERSAPPVADEPSTSARELPLSGLPAVKAALRPAGAAPAPGPAATDTSAATAPELAGQAPAGASPTTEVAAAAAAPVSANPPAAARASAPVQTPPAATVEPTAPPRRPAAEARAAGPGVSFVEKTAATPSTQPAREQVAEAAASRTVVSVAAGNEAAPEVQTGPTVPAAAPAVGAPLAGNPGEQVAALAPPPKPQSGPVRLHPRKHDPPEFPTRALRAHILQGHVVARVWVNAEGSVEQVDIVKADPPHVFDDEVKRALTAWTYDPPGRMVDENVELDFKP